VQGLTGCVLSILTEDGRQQVKDAEELHQLVRFCTCDLPASHPTAHLRMCTFSLHHMPVHMM